MTRPVLKFTRVFIAVVLTCFVLLPTAAAYAQAGDQVEPSGCVDCHRDLYLYYDMGKSYCLCETKLTCVDCHSGDPAAQTAEEAHAEMVSRPACAQSNTCRDCHPSDYQDHIDEFAAVAGIHATPCPLPECAHEPAMDTAGAVAECSQDSPLPWREIGAGLLSALSLGLVALAVYLYKTDNPTEDIE